MGFLSGFEHFVRDTEPLAPYTWLRLGGAAEYFAEPTCLSELESLVRRCRQDNVPLRVLGGGSNILVRDAGTPGVVVHLSSPPFCQIEVHGRKITAGAGAKLAHVVSMSVREGLAGLEQLVGIPGSVGGALHGNAGTQSGDIGQWTSIATLMTRSGEILTRTTDDLRFAYRRSSFDELAILSAEFELDDDDPTELTKRMQKHWIVKKSGQPMGERRVGWIFKDPMGVAAATLIEQAGLKGMRVGAAEVSEQHANCIIARSGACSEDVMRLIDAIRSQVVERLGVELERDIEIW